jgi:hypothetical protein
MKRLTLAILVLGLSFSVHAREELDDYVHLWTSGSAHTETGGINVQGNYIGCGERWACRSKVDSALEQKIRDVEGRCSTQGGIYSSSRKEMYERIFSEGKQWYYSRAASTECKKWVTPMDGHLDTDIIGKWSAFAGTLAVKGDGTCEYAGYGMGYSCKVENDVAASPKKVRFIITSVTKNENPHVKLEVGLDSDCKYTIEKAAGARLWKMSCRNFNGLFGSVTYQEISEQAACSSKCANNFQSCNGACGVNPSLLCSAVCYDSYVACYKSCK